MTAKAIVPTHLAHLDLENSWMANAALILGAVCLLALSARIEIPMPGSLIPLTTQTLAVLLIGASLGSSRALAATVGYLVAGGAGLPFFSGGAFGWSYFTGVTGGYLIGFLVAAVVMGFLSESRGWDQKFRTAWPLFLIGHLLIFACGVSWLALFVGWKSAVLTGLVPFVPGEILKTTIAASLTPALRAKL